MIQDPAQRAVVRIVQSGEDPLRGAVDAAVPPLLHRPQQPRSHHRRQRQGDQSGDGDGDAQRHRELPEQPPHQAAHQEDGDEHRQERDGDRHDGESDLARPLERRPQRGLAVLDEAGDVLGDHDCVVHHEAGGDGQRHQGQVVEAVPEQVHRPEGADQAERDRHAGDGGGPTAAKEDEDDQHHQGHAQEQRGLHVRHGRADGGAAIERHLHVDGRRDGTRQLREELLHALDHLDDVGAGLPPDDQQHRALPVAPGGRALVLDIVDHSRHVAQPDRGPVAVGEDQRPVIGRAGELVVGVDAARLERTRERALGRVGGCARQRGPDLLQREADSGQGLRIHRDADRGLLRAADEDLPDPGDLRDLLRQDGVRHVEHLAQGQRLGGERDDHDRRVRRVHLAVVRAAGEVLWKVAAGRVDRRLHVPRGGVHVPIEVELQGEAGLPERAGGRDLGDARDPPEAALQRSGHRRGHGLRAAAGQAGTHVDGRAVHARQRGHR